MKILLVFHVFVDFGQVFFSQVEVKCQYIGHGDLVLIRHIVSPRWTQKPSLKFQCLMVLTWSPFTIYNEWTKRQCLVCDTEQFYLSADLSRTSEIMTGFDRTVVSLTRDRNHLTFLSKIDFRMFQC